MHEFLESHLMIWMLLLILLIGVQIKTSLKETPKQGSIILWIIFALILIQTAMQSVNQEETVGLMSSLISLLKPNYIPLP